MSVFDAAARALVLGLSTGLLCLGSCAPVLLPVLLAEEKKGAAARWAPFLQFVAGRLAAYLLVGLAAGTAGGLLRGRFPPGLAGAGGLARDPVLRAIAQLAAIIAGVFYLILGVIRIMA